MKLLFNSILLLSVATMSDGQQHHQQQQQQQFLLQENKQRGNLRGLEDIEECGADGSCSDGLICDPYNNICVQCESLVGKNHESFEDCYGKFMNEHCYDQGCRKTQGNKSSKIEQCRQRCPKTAEAAGCTAECFPPTLVPIEPGLLDCGVDGSCSDELICDPYNNMCVQCESLVKNHPLVHESLDDCLSRFYSADCDCYNVCGWTQTSWTELLQCEKRCPKTEEAAGCTARCFPPPFVPIEPVLLLAAGKFAILTKTGVTTTGVTSITGDIGSSPITIASNTGFGMTLDSGSGGAFATSNLVDGEMYGADHAVPTPSMLIGAVGAMELAYTTAAGRVGADFTELGAGNIEGKTLEPGLYKWGTGVGITSSLVFNGPEDAVWILQVAGDVTIGTGAQMNLVGGAKAENIFWQVAGQTSFGAGTKNKGVFLCKTAIVFTTGSSLIGAALAQTAVTLDAVTIVKNSVCNTGASYPC